MWSLIGMFLCGFVFAFALIGIFIVSIIFDDERNLEAPTEDEMEQMSLWYDNEYGKEN